MHTGLRLLLLIAPEIKATSSKSIDRTTDWEPELSSDELGDTSGVKVLLMIPSRAVGDGD